MAENIGFIGLGSMGYPMAGNLRKKMSPSRTLVVNKSSRCEHFVEEFSNFGPIQVVGSPKEVATGASMVISIVPASKEVHQVYLDSQTGIIQAPEDPERVFLECSTIDIKTAKEVSDKLKESRMGTYIDSPVSGGVSGASAGTLAFMIGSKAPEDLNASSVTNRVKDVVSMMASPEKIFFTGQLGSGLAAKIANNYTSMCIIAATAEAMAMGVRSGVDPEMLHKIIKVSSGSSRHLDINPCMPNVVPTAPSSNGFAPNFKSNLAAKDLSLGIQAANDTGINPTCGEAAVELYKRAANDPRYKDLDCTAIWLLITEREFLG